MGQLTRRAQQRDYRGEADPPVQDPVGGGLVEAHGTHRLRCPDPAQAVLGEAGDQLVIQHRRGVDDAAQWPAGLFGGGNKPFGHARLGNVAEFDDDFCGGSQFVERTLGFLGRRGPAVENDASGTPVGEPARDRQTDATQAAGDDIGAVGAPRCRPCALSAAELGKGVRRTGRRPRQATMSSPALSLPGAPSSVFSVDTGSLAPPRSTSVARRPGCS